MANLILLAQLRVLFTTIIMVGSGAATLLKDLEDPFRGTFCVSTSALQLQSFEQLLMDDIAQAEIDARQAGPTFMSFANSDRPNYNTRNTLYLHLLTGPLGANIRFFGDIFSWFYQRISNGWVAVKNKARRRRQQGQQGIQPTFVAKS